MHVNLTPIFKRLYSLFALSGYCCDPGKLIINPTIPANKKVRGKKPSHHIQLMVFVIYLFTIFLFSFIKFF